MLGKDQAGSVLDLMCPVSLINKTSVIILQQVVLPVISTSPEGT